MYKPRTGPILMLLAHGVEETDVATVTRTLRRSGLPVALASLTSGPVRGAFGLVLEPDGTLSELARQDPHAVVLPGGVQGSRQLNADPRVHALLRDVVERGGYIVALDAAYTVLRSAGVLGAGNGPQAAGPAGGWGAGLPLSNGVEVEGNVVFGRDSGRALEAALSLVTLLERGGGRCRANRHSALEVGDMS